jgi:hypothetical protein
MLFFRDVCGKHRCLSGFSGCASATFWHGAILRESRCNHGKLATLKQNGRRNNCRKLEQRIYSSGKLPRKAIAVAFLDVPPTGIAKFEGTEPSGCSFWPLAAAGSRFNCLWACTHSVRLSPAREEETKQTLEMMSDLEYVKPGRRSANSALTQDSGSTCLCSARRRIVYARCGS